MAFQLHYYMHLCIICVMMMSSRCHSSVTQKPDDLHPSGEPHVPHVSDHRFFLQEIFTKYGHGGQMTFEGFEHLLESLGLGNIIINDHDVKAHKEESFRNAHVTHEHTKKVDVIDSTKRKETGEKESTRDANDPHDHQGYNYTPQQIASSTTRKSISSTESRHRHSHRNSLSSTQGSEKQSTTQSVTDYRPIQTSENRTRDDYVHSSDSIYHYQLKEANIPELLMNISHLVDQHQELKDESPEIVIQQCLSPKEILETFGIDQKGSLNPVSFLHLCPAIIYELDQGHCMFPDYSHRKIKNIVTLDQWLYSSVAVVAISLCGLFSVAVIPIMQKWFYQTLLQFLVGLAVGSLSGDALLHLMPHAMLGGEANHDHGATSSPEIAEKTAIWRGFTALGGILFFFIAEKLLAALTVYKKQKKDASLTKTISPVQNALLEGSVGQKLSQYRKNSHDYQNGKEVIKMLQIEPCKTQSHSCQDMGYSSSTFHSEPVDAFDVEIAQPRAHGHSHDVPHTVSAVAWMVIMGDGLHNFCDGLAIGAAFASGVEGGISTTVAVFCHELPHELGDFAMLLKTGMKVRQALLYNILSSILCFIGMVIGVSLGNVHSATSWVFAGTAGMFLYIALVDMLPELSSSSSDSGSTTQQLAVQVLGICTGVSIMLLIANYEEDLQAMVS